MRRKGCLLVLLLTMVMVVGCGKSEIVKKTEQAIEDIGVVDAESGAAIETAEKYYDALTDKQKEEVENYVKLVDARTEYEKALIEAEELAEATKYDNLPTFHTGECASTDLIELSINKSKFAYFASALSTTFTEPLYESDGGIFHVSKGHAFLTMTMTIKNIDTTSMSVGTSWSDGWNWKWKVIYEGEEYDLCTFDLNDKDGRAPLTLPYSMISSNGGNWTRHDAGNYLMNANETIDIMTLGVVGFEPAALNSPCELIINIPTSSGEDEIVKYVLD